MKDFLSKCDQIRDFPTDLVTFTEKIFTGKLHFICAVLNMVLFIGSGSSHSLHSISCLVFIGKRML